MTPLYFGLDVIMVWPAVSYCPVIFRDGRHYGLDRGITWPRYTSGWALLWFGPRYNMAPLYFGMGVIMVWPAYDIALSHLGVGVIMVWPAV